MDKRRKKFSTLLYFFPITTPTYTPLFYLSLKKTIEGGRKKKKKNSLHSLFLSLHPHIRKESKKRKEKRKGEEILKIF